MSEEGFDFWDAHLFWLSFIVEEDVALDPIDVGTFGAD
jgi:hypothetical protein